MGKSEISTLKLTGIAGYVKGTSFILLPGSDTVLGRSRDCTICLRGAQKAHQPAVDHEGHPRDEKSMAEHFKTVSSKHLRIRFVDDSHVIFDDLSRHGTFLDGRRVEKQTIIDDIGERSHEFRMGTNEAFRIELHGAPDARPQPKISVKKK